MHTPRSVPNDLARSNNRTTALSAARIPSVDHAVSIHTQQGGHLLPECAMVYGVDPIADYPLLRKLRERDFFNLYPSNEILFADVLHNQGLLFQQAIMSFVQINNRYCICFTIINFVSFQPLYCGIWVS